MSLTDKAEPLKSAGNIFAQEVAKPVACIFCGSPHVRWNGKRLRSASVLSDDGVIHLIEICCRRAKCGAKDCLRGWSLRPPGLAPHKHYQLCVVASAVSSYLFAPETNQAAVAQTHECSERMMGRWLHWVSEIADPAILQRRVIEVAKEVILVPVRDVENLARKARNAIRQEILPRAAQVLASFEALGMALGLEPPGLRGVIELVLENRSRIAT
jgi:hypothetical protein